MAAAAFTIGVEEEYQVVDPDTRELRPWADRVVAEAEPAVSDAVQPELYRSQVETHTPTCHGLDEVRAELRRLRRELVAAAERSGGRLVAAGTHPFSPWQDQPVTAKPRYLNLAEDFQALMREQVVFGCHVHVGIEDRELLVQTMNRVRVWLPVLLAVSANSPFWLGADTGYASYRAQVWNRWPMAGTPEVFASRAEHDALVESLVGTGVVREPTKLYWDVRASIRYPTLEFRVADVCATVDEAVLVAGLARALARTGYDAALAGEPLPAVRPELLRAARWRAARSGLEGELVDVLERRAVPAPELVESLLAYLGPALEAAGDAEQVQALARETLARGTGSTRQREVLEAGGRLTDVVDLLVAETARGV